MLIYNHEKELIGIDANDLNILGFKNLAQLKSETSDFANFFVKKPGFIHNFEHVHWIDFVHTANDVDTISEVIIKTKEKQYQATLQIESIYLNDEPSLPAFIIYLQDLKNIENNLTTMNDIQEYNKLEHFINESNEKIEEVVEEDLEELEKKDEFNLPEVMVQDKDEKVEIKLDDTLNDSYMFNPKIASQELGLSVDVVEDYILDFIKQAKKIKISLYSSLKDDDIENVKVLSHKLKGISANLRIDDIFNILTSITNSNDKDEIEKYLDTIYEKIEELSLRKEKYINNEIEITELSDDIFSQKVDEKLEEEEEEPEKLFETIEIMYDKDNVAKELGISFKNFEELFYDFIVESKILSNAINDAILENNPDSWIIEAIKFKGISRNMLLTDCVKELDKIIQTKDANTAQESINKIDLAIKNIANI